jgi:phosphotransferase system  glucose/maltose/N-acetylglucosamine-specific IIC component
MDETEESTIPGSASRAVRLLLGTAAGFFSVLMFITTPSSPSPVFSALFGMFCVAIALACATQGRVRQFFGSVIGCAVFGLTLCYLWVAGVGGPVTTDRPILLSLLSLLSAMPYFVCFGLPSAAYVVSARFGFARQP